MSRFTYVILFTLHFLIYGISNAQLSPFPFKLEPVEPEIIIESNSFDKLPEIAEIGNDYFTCIQHKIGNWNVRSTDVFRYKISTGEQTFLTSLEEIKFKDHPLFYEDHHVENGNVHLIYRTKKKSDSVYLVDRIVDSPGIAHPPKVLQASWVEEKSDDDNIEFGWNQDKSQLTILALQRDEKTGKAIMVRRILDKTLSTISVYRYDIDFPFENVFMVTNANLFGNTYVFIAVKSTHGTATAILELSDKGLKITAAGVKHLYIKGITLHKINNELRLSYLSFEDSDRDKLEGFHSSKIIFGEPQKLVTDIHYGDELKESDRDLYKYLREKESHSSEEYSIKSILEHPNGGYILSLHQVYSYVNDQMLFPDYYSEDYLISYIDEKGKMVWQKPLPITLGTNLAEHLNQMASFDKDGNFVMLTIDFTKNIETWKEGKLKSKLKGDMGVAAIQISPAGDVMREMVWMSDDESAVIVPSISNLRRIGNTDSYYSLLSMRKRKTKLVKVELPDLDHNAAKPQYEVLKFGKQY